jgi:hypothetical protein
MRWQRCLDRSVRRKFWQKNVEAEFQAALRAGCCFYDNDDHSLISAIRSTRAKKFGWSDTTRR